MHYKLYGNGIDVDTEAIQEMLDSGANLVELPVPEKHYLIDKPLIIHSYQELRLPRLCTIRLKDGSNCHMLENDSFENGNTDITVSGGIWDYNNMGQLQNPYRFPSEEFPKYDGTEMFFYQVKNLEIRNLTYKDPSTFACTLDIVSYFTVENIRFDYNMGNPRPINMDGIHMNGNCHYGLIHNIQGKCYDDMVAINADEGSNGPISHITVDGIYAEDTHSAVRFLTIKNVVSNIHITNVFGTFYQYCIAFTKYYKGETRGFFDGIVLDNIHASKAIRYHYLHASDYSALYSFVFPIICIEREVHIKSLTLNDLYRDEYNVPISTFNLQETSRIENLVVKNCKTVNNTKGDLVFFDIQGDIDYAEYSNNRIENGRMFSEKGETFFDKW